ncbi:Nucleocapsid phosphoprotein [Bat coronavirus HKU9-3]|uniref:Nucleocapsid phosphoprotein n=1 Tax=Bat coronavirus HKU9-3 TaxID=424369 RepID=A3EXI6_BCHK9|nr:Nucleocapsid phosphoprotein [Bat coronavirus HKU9-3]
MSGRNKPRPTSQPKVTFKQESDGSDSESERRNGNRSGARSKNNNGRGGAPKPEKPKAAPPQNVSWFAPLVQTGKQDLRFPRGQGVPISQGVDPIYNHGYWVRTQRTFQKGGKPVSANPRWYFYYTGTGRYGDMRYGTKNPDIYWVGEEGANVNRVGDMGTRNPNNDAAISVQLADGIPKGFYAEGRNSRGNSRNSSRNSSRASSRGGSRPGSRGASPGRATPSGSGAEPWMAYLVSKLETLEAKVNGTKSETKAPVQVTKSAAAENAKKLRHKRTPHKGSGVTMNYGRRGPGDLEGNFGDQTMLKLGVDDPRFPAVAQMAPNVASFIFMSHLSTREENDALWLQYKGAIKLPKDDPNYEQWTKLLAENLNAYKDFPPPEPKKDKKKKEEISSDTVVFEDASTGTDQAVVKVWVKDEGAQTDDEWLGGDDTVYEEEDDRPKTQRRHKKRNSTASRVTIADPMNATSERS